MSDPWREPARGGYPALRHLALPGLERLRALQSGGVAQPPISRLTGMRLRDASDGAASFEMPLTQWLCAPQGTIGIGPLVMPTDAAMACAIQTVLPPATPFTTSELTLRLLAPARPGRTLIVRGRTIQVRRTIGLADGSVTDEDGQLIAHGSTLCFIQPPLDPDAIEAARSGAPEAAEPSANGDASAADGAGPDPWQRPVRGEILAANVWERLSGLEVLAAQLRGELPAPPLHHFTGLTLMDAAEGEVTFEMPMTEWLCAPARRRVQGGGVAVLAEAALSAAIQTVAPAGTAVAPIDMKINYLRPVLADGRSATARGAVVHAGRRIAVANSSVYDADGRSVAVATGSAMLLAGRPASLGAAEE